MAQLSTDTLIYSQIVAEVQSFISSYFLKQNSSPKEFDEAYQKLLKNIHSKIGGISFDIELLNKGDAPRSEVINKMLFAISRDINMVNNQYEALAANYVNTYNMIANQIESEKNFMQRIKSKIDVLQIYSESPSSDITYFGDSFDNMMFIDSSKIRPGLLPDISDGYASLPKDSSKNWRVRLLVVNEEYNLGTRSEVSFVDVSNGLKGNNFLYYKNRPNDPFMFEVDSDLIRSNESAIFDQSPLTYFEYEAINVLENFSGKPEYEFLYSDGQEYINWSRFDTTKPLKLTLELTSTNRSGDLINYISILPFFGYDIDGANTLFNNVKVTSIKLFNESENKTYEIINSGPVTIGSDISSKSLDNYKNYFLNKGVFRFDEVEANKVYITLEQSEFKDVTIKHTYWEPYLYQTSELWNNQLRFDPDILINTDIREVAWDRKLLIPSIQSPNQLKSKGPDTKDVAVSYSTVTEGPDKHAIRLTKGESEYYWIRRDTASRVDLFAEKGNAVQYSGLDYLSDQRRRILGTPNVENENESIPFGCVLIDPRISESFSRLKMKVTYISLSSNILTVKTLENNRVSVGDKVFIYDGTLALNNLVNVVFNGTFSVTQVVSVNEFKVQFTSPSTISETDVRNTNLTCLKVIDVPTESNLTVESYKDTVKRFDKISVTLKRKFEELRAKRASIGIRDISLGRETYQSSAEIVSRPFSINGNLDLLSLRSAEVIPDSDSESNSSSIEYYFSVNNGAVWYPIQPVEKNFTGIPELYAFNQNSVSDVRLPQIQYLNSGKDPGIIDPINSIMFKIVIKKDKIYNKTPLLFWYKVGVKVR